MRALVAALIGTLLLVGCSSNATPEKSASAPVKKEQTASSQDQELDKQTEEGIYRINLYAEMTELNHQLLEYKNELGSGRDNLVGFRISTAILDTTEKLSKLKVPSSLEAKHKEIISYLLSGHKYLEEAMQADMDGKQVDWKKAIDDCFTDGNKAFMVVEEIKQEDKRSQ
ncbi:hypothetical protein [Thermoactinomyces sp. CICC 10521]|uniref:hypothetical protein n=1 Tax=Thermoactinomyces sp. CICC 10521 TaxID=2767426 RepID=UPI0018DE4B63|nr:hypothetical protein [Thermoactinomyces sp. CICC 10521]MBH8609081.1 hypothetical protein [Thermoactinomyces sp. CICC 10521]